MPEDLVRKGRLTGNRNADIENFLSSMNADQHIAESDVLVDIAHLTMLNRQGIIDLKYSRLLMPPLLEMYQKGVPEEAFNPSYEDIHAGIEAYLTKEAGSEAGGRLHIGRSRNDEVATCLRISARKYLIDQMKAVLHLRTTLLSLASDHTETVMPGFTHLQHAQPTTLAHYLLAYEQAFSRDYARMRDTFARLNLSPLGASAFATTGYPIDRKKTARYLGFDGLVLNTMDAVSGRDVLIELIAVDTILLMSVSRICEELVLWSSSLVNFVNLDEVYCSTSSIMPQKKNSDVAEILRSRCGTLLGRFVSAVTIMKGLPMAYNRDMQDLNPHLWESVKNIRRDIDLLRGMLVTANFNAQRMQEEAGKGFSTATELADTLVRNYGIPFRTAHNIVGRAVRSESLTLKTLDAASLEVMGKDLSGLGVTEKAIEEALSVNNSLSVRNHPGGPAKSAIIEAVSERRKLLEEDNAHQSFITENINEAIKTLLKDAKVIAETKDF